VKSVDKKDVFFMKKALTMAKRGGRSVRPNPRVGAVLVKNNQVLTAGYHSLFGGDHAEVRALKKAGPAARKATLYVTLEPCSSYSKTPPCIGKIIECGVSRVVIGCLDRNPANRNRAPRLLRRSGIKVTTGVLEKECFELNRDFFIWIKEKRPYTILKLAFSLDGRIATRTGHSRWISSRPSRRFSHLLRSQADAVLVGLGTLLSDDPALTVRLGYRHPDLKRIILDSRGRIPFSARVLKRRNINNTIVVTTPRAPRKKMLKLVENGAVWLRVPAKKGRVSLQPLFGRLARRGIMKLLIEGGGEVAASALGERLVDEVHFFIAPIIIGGKEAFPAVSGEGVKKIKDAYRLVDLKVSRSGPDIHLWGRIAHRA
jgi:diaminohydroxyphosphoribosylaminopyrimidine deaminase/5-amino-6-(5-phosphoribosylamino)uracil reductase